MAKKKYYVVWDGRETGVYNSWESCKEQVSGYPGAVYKSFASEELANEAFYEDSKNHVGNKKIKPQLTAEQKKKYGEPILESISVDGASSSRGGMSEYRGVFTHNAKEIFRKGPFPDGTNNLMEFLALVHALSLCKRDGVSLPIYSDSRTAISWVRKKEIKTTKQRTKKNEELFVLVDRALMWLKENDCQNKILKWETKVWGEIPADFNRK
ncbi:MAG: ribonuclease H [Bacteroidales bacterium]|jgi:ribonuclease HI|nr:ribonuclease H [Bacteroidales bacterium]